MKFGVAKNCLARSDFATGSVTARATLLQTKKVVKSLWVAQFLTALNLIVSPL